MNKSNNPNIIILAKNKKDNEKSTQQHQQNIPIITDVYERNQNLIEISQCSDTPRSTYLPIGRVQDSIQWDYVGVCTESLGTESSKGCECCNKSVGSSFAAPDSCDLVLNMQTDNNHLDTLEMSNTYKRHEEIMLNTVMQYSEGIKNTFSNSNIYKKEVDDFLKRINSLNNDDKSHGIKKKSKLSLKKNKEKTKNVDMISKPKQKKSEKKTKEKKHQTHSREDCSEEASEKLKDKQRSKKIALLQKQLKLVKDEIKKRTQKLKLKEKEIESNADCRKLREETGPQTLSKHPKIIKDENESVIMTKYKIDRRLKRKTIDDRIEDEANTPPSKVAKKINSVVKVPKSAVTTKPLMKPKYDTKKSSSHMNNPTHSILKNKMKSPQNELASKINIKYNGNSLNNIKSDGLSVTIKQSNSDFHQVTKKSLPGKDGNSSQSPPEPRQTIELTIRLIRNTPENTSETPVAETTCDSDNENQGSDLSFLDDIDVDEIVEILNVSDEQKGTLNNTESAINIESTFTTDCQKYESQHLIPQCNNGSKTCGKINDHEYKVKETHNNDYDELKEISKLVANPKIIDIDENIQEIIGTQNSLKNASTSADTRVPQLLELTKENIEINALMETSLYKTNVTEDDSASIDTLIITDDAPLDVISISEDSDIEISGEGDMKPTTGSDQNYLLKEDEMKLRITRLLTSIMKATKNNTTTENSNKNSNENNTNEEALHSQHISDKVVVSTENDINEFTTPSSKYINQLDDSQNNNNNNMLIHMSEITKSIPDGKTDCLDVPMITEIPAVSQDCIAINAKAIEPDIVETTTNASKSTMCLVKQDEEPTESCNIADNTISDEQLTALNKGVLNRNNCESLHKITENKLDREDINMETECVKNHLNEENVEIKETELNTPLVMASSAQLESRHLPEINQSAKSEDHDHLNIVLSADKKPDESEEIKCENKTYESNHEIIIKGILDEVVTNVSKSSGNETELQPKLNTEQIENPEENKQNNTSENEAEEANKLEGTPKQNKSDKPDDEKQVNLQNSKSNNVLHKSTPNTQSKISNIRQLDTKSEKEEFEQNANKVSITAAEVPLTKQAKPKNVLASKENSNEPAKGLDKKITDLIEKRISGFLCKYYSVTALVHNGKFSEIFMCKSKDGDVLAAKLLKKNVSTYETGIEKEKIIKEILNTHGDISSIVPLINGLAIDGRWCFLFEYYALNLEQALEDRKRSFHIGTVQILARQLFAAVLFLRNHCLVHSSISPKHVLVSPAQNRLKLCGLDEVCHISELNVTSSMGCVHYRPPEVILGYTGLNRPDMYDTLGYALDVWSAALVAHEMATNKKLFPAKTNTEVLFGQIRSFGSVPYDMLKNCTYRNNYYKGRSFVRPLMRDGKVYDIAYKRVDYFWRTNYLEKVLYDAQDRHWGKGSVWDKQKIYQFSSLLYQMLTIEPYERINIEFAYADPFIYEEYEVD